MKLQNKSNRLIQSDDELKEAVERENNLISAIMQQRSPTIPEAFDPINEASRDIIKAMYKKYGQVYLGKINAIRKDQGVLEQYCGGKIYNFSCDFCIPAYSGQIECLVLQWRKKGEIDVLKKIFDAITKHDGQALFWS